MIRIPINSFDYMMETAIEEQLSEVSGAIRPVSVLLVYPSTSDVALANLGFQRVYSLLNGIDGVTCDRFSLPPGWDPTTPQLKSDQLRSHDLGRLPMDFDLIAFSISFEPDYLNTVLILDYFGIPLDRKQRGPAIPAGYCRRIGVVHQPGTVGGYSRPVLHRRGRGHGGTVF